MKKVKFPDPPVYEGISIKMEADGYDAVIFMFEKAVRVLMKGKKKIRNRQLAGLVKKKQLGIGN